MERTVLLIPTNDPEAVLIFQIATALGIPTLQSGQPHGAVLEREKDLLQKIRASGATRVVIVEMPGLETEKAIRQAGIDLEIIDHHQYTDLDRAHDAKGRELPSSLIQFLKRFRIMDAKLKRLGFDPRLVRGIAILDQGFVWLALKRGYAWREIHRLFAYTDELMGSVRNMRDEEAKREVAQRAWDKRRRWKKYFIVEGEGNLSLRPRLSRIVALARRKPTPLIVIEHGRGFIYVQETDKAQKLFDHFGGFTFGEHHNWGYKNAGAKKKVTVDDVLKVL